MFPRADILRYRQIRSLKDNDREASEYIFSQQRNPVLEEGLFGKVLEVWISHDAHFHPLTKI